VGNGQYSLGVGAVIHSLIQSNKSIRASPLAHDPLAAWPLFLFLSPSLPNHDHQNQTTFKLSLSFFFFFFYFFVSCKELRTCGSK
jgi:hypothetical protein